MTVKRVVICEIVCNTSRDAKELEREIIDLITKENLGSKLVESVFTDIISEKLALNQIRMARVCKTNGQFQNLRDIGR